MKIITTVGLFCAVQGYITSYVAYQMTGLYDQNADIASVSCASFGQPPTLKQSQPIWADSLRGSSAAASVTAGSW